MYIKVLQLRFKPPSLPGAAARSIARPPGMQTVAGSILTSGKTFFRWDLVMIKFLRSQIQEGQLSVTGEKMGTKYW